MNLPNLGIIGGAGKLPYNVAEAYTAKKGKVYIAALATAAEIDSIQNYPYQIFKIGQVGAIIDYFKSNDVKQIIIIGGIQRPNLFNIKVDKEGSLLLAQIIKNKFLGDDQLLKTISAFIEQRGFKVISPKVILANTSKLQTVKLPDNQDLIDITLGYKAACLLGDLDVGQSVIVQDGYVIGLEGAEGTDNLITRCAILRKKINGGVLVKLMKKNQDQRLDIPAIGPKTVELLYHHQYCGLAIDNQVSIVDQALTFSLADKLGLFIHMV